jgi:hypothetical protein
MMVCLACVFLMKTFFGRSFRVSFASGGYKYIVNDNNFKMPKEIFVSKG